jgi:hypothetical protein
MASTPRHLVGLLELGFELQINETAFGQHLRKVMNPLKKIISKGPRQACAAGFRRLASMFEPASLPAPTGSDLTHSGYLKHLFPATGGWPNHGNIETMNYVVQHRPDDAAMLEIGTFCGQSVCALAYLLEKSGAPNRLFCCDIWRYDEGTATPASPVGDARHLTYADYNRFILDSYIRNAKFFCHGNPPSSLEIDSDNFFSWWHASREATDVFGRTVQLGGPLSFCFIDGNHNYDYARRDFENTDRLLVPGGFILFDDSADDSPWVDVRKVVSEVLATGQYKLISKNPNYLLQKI